MLKLSAMNNLKSAMKLSAATAALVLSTASALAQDTNPAEPALVPPTDQVKPAADVPAPEVPIVFEPVWKIEHAEALLAVIKDIGKEGLKPSDYKPDKLAAEIAKGQSTALDVEFVRAFTWLAEDLRDGRTPMKSRVQWFVEDPDADNMPSSSLLAKVMATGDVAGTLKSLEPAHADYVALRTTLAITPADQVTRRRLIAANMDRWRWLKRDMGKDYLHTNVPEFMLRYVVNKQQIATYRTVVGKPGNTATPQLAEKVQGVIFNPTWTVPQSIVKGEGLGAKVLANPSWAAARGYKAAKGPNGYVSVVQGPGPTNSLGYMKLDMPNPHAIFLHDTPSRHLFKNASRALSHGCIRTEDAMALAMAIALVQGEVPVTKSKEIIKSLEYTRVPVKNELPVYITYFTMATNVDGKLQSFGDIYARDKPVFDAMAAARPIRAGKMTKNKDVVVITRPGA